MRIKAAIEAVPGGMMVIPLLAGAAINTIDHLHLAPIQQMLEWLGATGTIIPGENGEGGTTVYRLLEIGGFTTSLFKTGTPTLIALFLFCAGSQMDLRIGGRSVVKGSILLSSKYLTGLGIGFLVATVSDPMSGLFGLSFMAIVAGMSNGNGGLYAGLSNQYGNRSDVGAIAVLSLNDGPFLTFVALGIMGQHFPAVIFLGVLLPIALGMLLGNLDPALRTFFAPGEKLLVPFFAFALGAGMNLALFLSGEVLLGGMVLGITTLLFTGLTGALWYRIFGYRSQIGAWSEASCAGNAAATPTAVTGAFAGASAVALAYRDQLEAQAANDPSLGGLLAEAEVEAAAAAALHKDYAAIQDLATGQISVAVLTTALLCPLAVVLWDRWQRQRGIDGRHEDDALPHVFSHSSDE